MCTKEMRIFCLSKCVRKRLTSSVFLNVYKRDQNLLSPLMCTEEIGHRPFKHGKHFQFFFIFFDLGIFHSQRSRKWILYMLNEIFWRKSYFKWMFLSVLKVRIRDMSATMKFEVLGVQKWMLMPIVLIDSPIKHNHWLKD